ncbi:MAG: T9SS type A sorting domain-containing protein [Bacteroidota bacterium]
MRAQPTGDSLAWELVGEPLEARGLFAAGLGDGLAPAVYANGDDGLFVIRPGEADWTLLAPRGDLRANRSIFVSRAGTFLAGSGSSIQRSTDDGQTWARVLDGGYVAPVYTPEGALVTGLDGDPEDTVARSTDDGLTWTEIDMAPSLGTRFLPITFAGLPASGAQPGGVLVAGGNGGLAYSADDGLSWQATNVFGTFAFRASSVVRAPWGGSAPGRGTLYAAVNDFSAPGIGEVWESTDGTVWQRVGLVPGTDSFGALLVAVADDEVGEVLFGMYLTEREDLQVYRSVDRGQTWVGTGKIEAEELVGNPVKMNDLVVGPEGRLWLGMDQGTGGPGLTGGVFRTVEPVFVVSSEEEPEPGKRGVELGAPYPNPVTGKATVALTLPTAAEVSVTVFDVLGRRVSVLADGRLETGQHRMDFDASVLPSGVYLVRATVNDRRALTQRLTVIR